MMIDVVFYCIQNYIAISCSEIGKNILPSDIFQVQVHVLRLIFRAEFASLVEFYGTHFSGASSVADAASVVSGE